MEENADCAIMFRGRCAPVHRHEKAVAEVEAATASSAVTPFPNKVDEDGAPAWLMSGYGLTRSIGAGASSFSEKSVEEFSASVLLVGPAM
jgi:hypothetical protein